MSEHFGLSQTQGFGGQSSTTQGLDVSLNNRVQELDEIKQRIRDLEALVVAPRVVLQNFEGIFKTLAAAPTAADTDFQDGTLLLSDVSGTRTIHVRINGTWYGVPVT